jgi:hypothetical protein
VIPRAGSRRHQRRRAEQQGHHRETTSQMSHRTFEYTHEWPTLPAAIPGPRARAAVPPIERIARDSCAMLRLFDTSIAEEQETRAGAPLTLPRVRSFEHSQRDDAIPLDSFDVPITKRR